MHVAFIGLIAEDVLELVATNGRHPLSPFDAVAVLTKVNKVQQRKILQSDAQISQLIEDMTDQKSRVFQFESSLAKILLSRTGNSDRTFE